MAPAEPPRAGAIGILRQRIKVYIDNAAVDPYAGEPLVVNGQPSRRLWHRVFSWAKLCLLAGVGGCAVGIGTIVCGAGVAVLVGAVLTLAGALVYLAEILGLCAVVMLVLNGLSSPSSKGTGR